VPAITDENRRWWVLGGASAGMFILMLDSTVVSVALPSIRRELDASTADLQWMQNIYLLMMSAFVVTLSRAGDLLGRKRSFQAGMVVFGVGSVVSATAIDPLQLIGGRAIQGLGAAALISLSLALVTVAFPGEDRSRALGIWTALSSVALAIGPLIGGLIVELASWRWIFWINVPFMLGALALVGVAAVESRDATAARRLDPPGLLTLSPGLFLLVLALVQGKSWGWASAATIGAFGAGLLLLVAFVAIERRVAAPIVDFGLFGDRAYLGASAAAFALVGSYWFIMFALPQYLELVLGYTSLASGLLILPVTAPMIVLSATAARMAQSRGARAPMTLGMCCALAGTIVITFVDADSSYAAVLPGLVLFGIAMALVYTPMSAAAMAALPADKAGIAAGVLAMTRTLGGALMLAACGALLQHVELDREAAGAAFPSAYADGFAAATWLLVALLAVGTLLTARLTPRSARAEHMHHRPAHL
jgi:EmrB/QacA subfamily drug resistance transporter